MQERIAVIGLGYVGLPVALAFARKFPETIGFDIDRAKVEELRRGEDRNGEVPREALTASTLKMTADTADLAGANVYRAIIEAGVHRAQSIKVAEAAKVIENTQRDINIALMNELALIFDRMGIRTNDVLDAAGTKWNFLKFKPGLVGGHCIGVDPYYLTTKAQELGYLPEVILAGRRINNNVGPFIAQKCVKMLTSLDVPLRKSKVGIIGLPFKENVPDLRNSKIPDIIAQLTHYRIEANVHH